MTFSRSRTRRFILQTLYARSIAGSGVSKEAPFFDDADTIDSDYADSIIAHIIDQESKLLSVIYEHAPKYDIKSIPLINLIILLLSLTEILLSDAIDVPPRVAVNEALELAKRYSDEPSKNLINGILHKVLASREEIITTWGQRVGQEYTIFHVL